MNYGFVYGIIVFLLDELAEHTTLFMINVISSILNSFSDFLKLAEPHGESNVKVHMLEDQPL